MDIKWTHLENTLNAFLERFIELAHENLDKNGTNASHGLYNSIKKFNKSIVIEDTHYTVSVELADYWKYVEYGTGPQHKPDARAQYWPKVGPIKEWVNVKQGVPKDESFAYAVVGKIHLSGTTAQPFFEPAKEQAIMEFEDAIEKAIDEDISAFIEEQVIAKLEETLKRF